MFTFLKRGCQIYSLISWSIQLLQKWILLSKILTFCTKKFLKSSVLKFSDEHIIKTLVQWFHNAIFLALTISTAIHNKKMASTISESWKPSDLNIKLQSSNFKFHSLNQGQV